MTEREAISVFDGLREALQSIPPGEDARAVGALLRTHVFHSSSIASELSSALAMLRNVFREIQKWETQNPN